MKDWPWVVGIFNSRQAWPVETVFLGGLRGGGAPGTMKHIQKDSCGRIFEGLLWLNMLKAYCLIYTFIHDVSTPESILRGP